MKDYVVTGTVTISVSTHVTASSPARAQQMALARPLQRLCHQCAAGDPARAWVTSGELDGEIHVLDAEIA